MWRVLAAVGVLAIAGLSGCGDSRSDATKAFCRGLVGDYPKMLGFMTSSEASPESVDASVVFLEGLYTDEFADGAPDRAQGELVVEGAKAAASGELNADEVAQYQAAFEALKEEGESTCE